MERLLSAKQAADLAGLLAAVSEQPRLGRECRDEAGYWASQIDPGLDVHDARTITWLLEDVAASPWLPDPMEQWARAWAASLGELTRGPAPP